MRALKAVRQNFGSYHLKSGVFHFYRGEHGPAAEYLTRVLTEDSDVSDAERRAAQYYLVQTLIGAASELEQQDDYDRAIEQYQRALAVIPSYPDVQFRLGLALRERNRAAESLTHFRRAIASNPRYVEALVELGFTLLDLDELAEGQQRLREAEDARAEKVRRKLAAAEAALAAGMPDTAREIYADAFRTDLETFRARVKLGLDLLRTEKWDDAIEELQTAARLCPRFADVHNYLGVALAESGRLEEAIEAFRRSVAINEAYAVAWLNLAYTAHALGDEGLAREALEPVLRSEPDNGPARHLAGQLGSKPDSGTRRSRATQGSA